MPKAFKAIIVLEDEQSGGGQPPGIWGGTPPPYPDQGLPGKPPGIWGGAPSYPDQGLPGGQPGPSHPIVIPPPTEPGQPPEIWPKPGQPAHPIVIPPDAVEPGVPSHPIYLPPVVWPPQQPGHPSHPIAPGGQPPGIWGGGNAPMPTPPIYIPLPPGEELPPDGEGNSPTHPIVLPPDTPPDPNGTYVLVHAFIPGYGGCWFLVNTAQVGNQPPTPQPK